VKLSSAACLVFMSVPALALAEDALAAADSAVFWPRASRIWDALDSLVTVGPQLLPRVADMLADTTLGFSDTGVLGGRIWETWTYRWYDIASPRYDRPELLASFDSLVYLKCERNADYRQRVAAAYLRLSVRPAALQQLADEGGASLACEIAALLKAKQRPARRPTVGAGMVDTLAWLDSLTRKICGTHHEREGLSPRPSAATQPGRPMQKP
jgi:hypothetical protein